MNSKIGHVGRVSALAPSLSHRLTAGGFARQGVVMRPAKKKPTRLEAIDSSLTGLAAKLRSNEPLTPEHRRAIERDIDDLLEARIKVQLQDA